VKINQKVHDKINEPIPGLLVYWSVMLLTKRLKIKFTVPWRLRFLANCSFFGQYFILGHYPGIYQPPEGFIYYISYHTIPCPAMPYYAVLCIAIISE